MTPHFPTSRSKWIIAIVILALYSVGAAWFARHNGPPALIFSVIPVSLVGFLTGMYGGMGAGIYAIIIGILILLIPNSNVPWISLNGSLLSNWAILFLIGLTSGLLRQNINNRIRKEAELQSREHFLSLLSKITDSIIASDDPEVMIGAMIKDLRNVLEADDCRLIYWNEELNIFTPFGASAISNDPYDIENSSPEQASILRSVIQENRSLAVEDVFNSTYVNPSTTSKHPARSILGAPLLHGKIKIGVLWVVYNTSHKFQALEIEWAQQVGSQIAIAIWNTRQEFELQKRSRESNTLTKIAHALSQSERIGLVNVLELIAASAQELIPGAEQAVIHLLDEEEKFLVAGAASGVKDALGGNFKMRLGEGIAGQVIAMGETINISDISMDERFVKLGGEPTFRSLMVAPIISGDQKLGTISVQSHLPRTFTNNEKHLLSTLGTQAAIAIENANLLESMQQTLKETNALYRINQGMAALNADELLADVADLLQKNFGYYHVQVYVIDSQTGDFIFQAGSGEIGRKLKEQKVRLPAGAGIIGYAAETSAPFFTNNVDEVVFFIREELLPETKSELAIPVKIGEQLLGILDIQQAPPGIFTNRDLQLVNAVADQLAIALQKADLYKELQTSLQHEKEVRNQLVQNERLAVMGRLLASVSHELNNPLQAIQNALFLLKAEQVLSPQGRQDLEIVLSEAERMAAMIERLRATYRPSATEDFNPVQINTIVEDVYALISTHLRHGNILFEFHPDTGLPEIPGLADQLRQVILNLFMNAVEAMETDGRVIVCTEYHKSEGMVYISIEDNGPGIASSILPNIFDAFITNKETGTGLGLTITHDIIIKHQGRITAENNMDGGATFKMWLPITRMENV